MEKIWKYSNGRILHKHGEQWRLYETTIYTNIVPKSERYLKWCDFCVIEEGDPGSEEIFSLYKLMAFEQKMKGYTK